MRAEEERAVGAPLKRGDIPVDPADRATAVYLDQEDRFVCALPAQIAGIGGGEGWAAAGKDTIVYGLHRVYLRRTAARSGDEEPVDDETYRASEDEHDGVWPAQCMLLLRLPALDHHDLC
jgi:hypothetical protein